MKTGFSAVGDSVSLVELILLAKRVPILLLRFRQYEDDVDVGVVFAESADGAHEYRQSVDRKELLGNIAAHTQSLTTCDYYDIIHCVALYLYLISLIY